MSIKIASHLFRNRHGTFYFRFVIPKDLQSFLNQREIRFSLVTEKRQDPKSSHIVVAVVNGEAVVKRFVQAAAMYLNSGQRIKRKTIRL